MSKRPTPTPNRTDWAGRTAGAESARAVRSPCIIRDRVLLVLMYYRTYLTQDGMTHFFGITQGSISTNIMKLSPVIRDCLPTPQDLYKEAKKVTTIEEMEEIFPGMVALTDATEQPILKPQDPEEETAHYSGKAKTHTIKVQYTTSFDGLVVHKTSHSPGRDHDFKVYKMKHPTFPTGLPSRDGDAKDEPGRDHLRHYGDTAYRGMDKVVEGIDARLSVMREPGKDLTSDQREYNKAHSRIHMHP